jgi:hypothetical protein
MLADTGPRRTISLQMQTQLEAIAYVTRVEELVWGLMLLALSMTIHGLGMVATLHVASSFKKRFASAEPFLVGIGTIIVGSWLIVTVLITEIVMWASFFQWKQCFSTFSTATYFTGLQYTTVGSSLNLPKEWRLLEIMLSVAGLMGFAWSTGVLMTLAQDFQSRQLRLLDAVHFGSHRNPAPTPLKPTEVDPAD